MSNYQRDVLREIYKHIHKKKSFISNGEDHMADMKIIDRIKNEI